MSKRSEEVLTLARYLNIKPNLIKEQYGYYYVNPRFVKTGLKTDEAVDRIEMLREALRTVYENDHSLALRHPDEWDCSYVKQIRSEQFNDISVALRNTIHYKTRPDIGDMWLMLISDRYGDRLTQQILRKIFNGDYTVTSNETKQQIDDGVYDVITEDEAYDLAYENARSYYKDKAEELVSEEAWDWFDVEGFLDFNTDGCNYSEWLGTSAVYWEDPITGEEWVIVKDP